MQDFKGKTAVITGGASGIGLGVALALAREGANVAVADLNEDRARAAAGEIEATGVQALAVRCNVAEPEDIARMRQAVLDRFGRVDILMNNAGVLPVGRFEDFPFAEWQRATQVNFLAQVAGVHAFLPDLSAQSEAHIVNTASFAGLISYDPGSLAYSATKAAVVNFSEGLAVYLKPRGIGVTCLCPGGVTTNIREQTRLYGEAPNQLGIFCSKQVPTRTPDEVGQLVLTAIREGRFLLPTDPIILDLYREHAASPEAFVDRIIETVRG